MFNTIVNAIATICMIVGGGFLLVIATAALGHFRSWLKDKYEELKLKTYRIEYYYFKYQKTVDCDECLVFPMKNVNYCYVKERSLSKAVGKFCIDNYLGSEHTVIKHIEEVKV